MPRCDELKKIANEVRKKIIERSIPNGGHISTSFSCVEILVSLYFGDVLNISSKKPYLKNRDRFILSKGHAETGFYSVLSEKKFFPESWWKNYRTNNCKLGGHADHNVPGVELTTGSLGHGLSYGAGISYSAKLYKYNYKQFVLIGDAECSEGSIWEAALFSSKYKLDNLIAIIDKNEIGSLDFVSNFTKIDPLKDKWISFGWNVKEINGHNFNEIIKACNYFKKIKNNKPSVIIANTIKGKGVSFIENDPIWHVKQLNDLNEIEQARKELRNNDK